MAVSLLDTHGALTKVATVNLCGPVDDPEGDLQWTIHNQTLSWLATRAATKLPFKGTGLWMRWSPKRTLTRSPPTTRALKALRHLYGRGVCLWQSSDDLRASPGAHSQEPAPRNPPVSDPPQSDDPLPFKENAGRLCRFGLYNCEDSEGWTSECCWNRPRMSSSYSAMFIQNPFLSFKRLSKTTESTTAEATSPPLLCHLSMSHSLQWNLSAQKIVGRPWLTTTGSELWMAGSVE